jgi:hypothetical protein
LPERDQRHASGVATASGLGPGIFVQRLNARFPEGLRMSARRERSTRYGAVVRKPSRPEPIDRALANGGNRRNLSVHYGSGEGRLATMAAIRAVGCVAPVTGFLHR